jgi:glutamyl-tRNA synthetase
MHLGELGIDPAEDGPSLVDVVKAQCERAQTLKELAQISRFYYQDFDEYNENAVKKAFKPAAVEPLKVVRGLIEEIQEWNRENLHAAIESTVQQLDIGFGKVGMPLRTAVTGGAPSPDLDLTLYLVGKAACLRRIDQAINEINKRNSG